MSCAGVFDVAGDPVDYDVLCCVLCKLCEHGAHLDFEIVLPDLIRGRDLLLSIVPSEARESTKLLYSVKFVLELKKT